MDKKEKDKLWRLNNKDKIKIYNQLPERKEKERERARQNTRKNSKLEIQNLEDKYVVNVIKNRTGLSKITIRKYPDYIESYRQQIKVKRLIKQIKNG